VELALHAGTGSLTRTLEALGGPLPATQRTLSGTISLRNPAGTTFTITAGSDVTFSISVPADTYAVTGRSPLYQSAAVDCQTAGPVIVSVGGTSRAVVSCQER
jgi:hypothetical protein